MPKMSSKLFELAQQILVYYPGKSYRDILSMVADGESNLHHANTKELEQLAEEFLERINHGEL